MKRRPPRRRRARLAKRVGLIYVESFDHGIGRRRCGRGFTFLSPTGRTIRSLQTKKRIKSLAIPPAWTEVWICPESSGHIQARGRDDAGRVQYIYHPLWVGIRDATKFDCLERFARVLPRIRRRVRRDLNRDGLEPERVLAAVVRVLDRGRLRIGNGESVEARGATTLEPQHVELDDETVTLDFPGKSGQRRHVEFRDEKVAEVIRQCEELDGQTLFRYLRNGVECAVGSADVNRYLRAISGENLTAKVFRTWWGTVTAFSELVEIHEDSSPAERRRAIRSAVKAASETLGNTIAVCKSSYIHPGLLTAAESGQLPQLLSQTSGETRAELTRNETLVFDLLPRLELTQPSR